MSAMSGTSTLTQVLQICEGNPHRTKEKLLPLDTAVQGEELCFLLAYKNVNR